MTLQPVDITFNMAIRTMAHRTNPEGWTTSPDNNVDDLGKLNAMMAFGMGNTVWEGASRSTIYGCEEDNWAGRAWHDAVHYQLQAEFNVEGEALVVAEQVRQLALYLPPTFEKRDMFLALLEADILGTVEHYAIHGEWPEDQRVTVLAYANRLLAARGHDLITVN